MRARTASASLFLAAALVAAPAASALAGTSPGTTTGATKHSIAKARAEAHRLEARAHSKRFFVLGGKVTAVTPADPTVAGSTSTLTFTVHGGRYKELRGTDVTVTVLPDAKVTRDGVVDLPAVQIGDHVVVKSRDFAFSVDKTVSPAAVTVTATVSRVAASPTDDSVEPAATTAVTAPAV